MNSSKPLAYCRDQERGGSLLGMSSLKDQTVLVVGRGGGIARAVVFAARDAGARVIAAGRDQEALPAAYDGEPDVSVEAVDLTDEASIAALGERLGSVAADTLVRSLALELGSHRRCCSR
jgi:NAD(P)-dependent dehydrogenase (short-subunit alcohol dehydrogenase family)